MAKPLRLRAPAWFAPSVLLLVGVASAPGAPVTTSTSILTAEGERLRTLADALARSEPASLAIILAVFAGMIVAGFLMTWLTARCVDSAAGTIRNTLWYYLWSVVASFMIVAALAATVFLLHPTVAAVAMLPAILVSMFWPARKAYGFGIGRTLLFMIAQAALQTIVSYGAIAFLEAHGGDASVTRPWREIAIGWDNAGPSGPPAPQAAATANPTAASIHLAYRDLTRMRETLDTGNPDAVRAFNRKVAEYNDLKGRGAAANPGTPP